MDNFGLREAHVACHQLDYARALTYGLATGLHGPEKGDINMDNLTCSGAETMLHDYKFNGWGKHDCDHSKDTSVVCDPCLSCREKNSLIIEKCEFC